MAARSSGREWRSAPRGDLPTAVRKQSTITASRIGVPFCCDTVPCSKKPLPYGRGSDGRIAVLSTHRGFMDASRFYRRITAPISAATVSERLPSSVPQRLPMLQHVLHAFLRLHIPAQAEKRFALQIQQILLRDLLRAGQPSAAQHVRLLLPLAARLLRDVAPIGRQRHSPFERGVTRLAFHRNN